MQDDELMRAILSKTRIIPVWMPLVSRAMASLCGRSLRTCTVLAAMSPKSPETMLCPGKRWKLPSRTIVGISI